MLRGSPRLGDPLGMPPLKEGGIEEKKEGGISCVAAMAKKKSIMLAIAAEMYVRTIEKLFIKK